MNKKGFIVEVGAFVLICLVTLGIYLTVEHSDTLYIGNKATGYYLDYFKCKSEAQKINEENMLIFASKQEAQLNYNATEGCV